ncbi:hypothetical protein BJX63DRAFT_444419 [Aspergillus granulosus]|uniref:DUF1774-domain-containing protein n=1 Tax=Aspergillus granulosus TaxID=176169 RepID=A0ABR4H6C1_9EURO
MAPNIYNPFARRESHDRSVLTTYRVLAPLMWLLVVVFGIYYSVREPDDVSNSHTIWDNFNRRITPFSVEPVVTWIYWVLLLLTQLNYISQLFSKDTAVVTSAANIAAHFILNNLFVFAWILLWTRNHFWPAEVIVAVHFIHQHLTFWRVHGLTPLTHLSVIAAPYAWTLLLLFWNGSAAAHTFTPAAEIAANIFIWVFFVIGAASIILAVDDLLGYSLSLLSLGLAVQQFTRKRLPLQWIFAWVIFAVFFVKTLYVTATKYSGRTIYFRRATEPEPTSTDAERAPLLNDSAPVAAA